MTRPVRRGAFVLLVTVLVAGLLTACSSSGCESGDKGYVDCGGVINLLEEKDRKRPGTVEGTTLDGDEVSLADYRGKVVVINVWGSWCPPCRSEADDLAVAWEETRDKDVVFLGINTRDNSSETALAFQRSRKVPYASIFDPGGSNLTQFRGTLNPKAIPSTLIIDAEGRVAASIVGEVTSARTLVDLIDDVAGTAS